MRHNAAYKRDDIMARFSFSIPDEVAEMLDRDVENKSTSRSSLIAEFIERHYKRETQRKEDIDVVQRVRSEWEKKVQHLIAEHDAEVLQIRTEYEKQLEQINADNAANTQQLENDVERLEKLTEKLENDLKASEERNASAVEKLRQSESSKNVVVNGLQHEVELLKKDNAKLESELQTEKILSNERKADKENLQKQLELVTLRLPPPKVGFWTRLFGGGEKKEE
jgi:metal-responsive CopG/Arc/MetJ family transcriptional regulator